MYRGPVVAILGVISLEIPKNHKNLENSMDIAEIFRQPTSKLTY